jgi:hypothetical protein
MTVSTTISPTLGVVTTIDSADSTTPGIVVLGGVQQQVTDFTAGATLTPANAGVVTISKTGSAATLVMPLASSCAGAMFTVRSTTAYAHVLTGSQEAGGTLVFSDGTSHGSRATLANVAGSSVALLSDGKSFLVLGSSGSVTIAGT